MKSARVQLLGEHVTYVIIRPNERHHELHGLDHVPNVEVPTLNIFRAFVVLRVVREIARCLVVSRAGL